MQFGTIASGSSGNCIYVGTEETHLLVDAGISGKRVREGLSSFGLDGDMIDGLLITHEHSDHVAGVGVLSRKFHIPIYATTATFDRMMRSTSLGKIDPELFREVKPYESFSIKDIDIEPFSIPHDAADPVSYTMESEHTKVGMVTDLGYYDKEITSWLELSDLLYIEANHDIHMLEVGPYPYPLKQRILSSHGHLCNEMAGQLIGDLNHKDLKHVILGHLSKENNYPELALETVKSELGRQSFDLEVAPRSCASSLITL